MPLVALWEYEYPGFFRLTQDLKSGYLSLCCFLFSWELSNLMEVQY